MVLQFWPCGKSGSEEIILTVLRADILRKFEAVVNRTVDGLLEGVQTSSLPLLAEAARSRADAQIFLSELSALALSGRDLDAVAQIGRSVGELSKSTSRIVTNLAIQNREIQALEAAIAKMRMRIETKGDPGYEEED